MTQSSLQLKLAGGRPIKDPQAWKALVGTNPVDVRFSLLPETKPRMGALGASLILQICLAIFFVMIPLLFPQQMIPKTIYLVTSLAGPPLDIPEPPKPKPPAAPKVARVQPTPEPIATPPPRKLKPETIKFIAPKVKPREVVAELPKVNETFQPMKLEVPTTQPARPREPVKTNVMTAGSSAVPTMASKPLDKVQTGGFGDSEGVAGPSNPNKRANVGQFGNEALPPGPGYGNGTGGANGTRGIVSSTGFGNGVAIPPPAEPHKGAVKSVGFADQNSQVIEIPKKKVEAGAPAIEPVIILEKPKPMYSAEALKMNIEGEVLLDVVFRASGGEVHVNRIVKGLGHGLDEAAMKAAAQIKYKPAISNGHPVDFPAIVHIVFQTAY